MATSLLFKLPAELRNAIYELALVEPDGIDLAFIGQGFYSTGEEVVLQSWTSRPNLLLTCKAIRHEALPIFLANPITVELARFELPEADDLAAWAMAYGSGARLIKNLRVSFSHIQHYEFDDVGDFAKRLLHLLEPLGVRPSIAVSIDFYNHAVDSWLDSTPEPAYLDFVKRSAAENRLAIQQAVNDTKDIIRSDDSIEYATRQGDGVGAHWPGGRGRFADD